MASEEEGELDLPADIAAHSLRVLLGGGEAAEEKRR